MLTSSYFHSGVLLPPLPYSGSYWYSSLPHGPTSTSGSPGTCPSHPAPTAAAVPLKLRLRCLSEAAEAAELTARERRQLRQQRREANSTNWKEEVEERLLLEAKKKKKTTTRKDKLSINKLAALGPQWWAVLVTRSLALHISNHLPHTLSTNFPEVEFKVYFPCVQEGKILKDGTIDVKRKPIVPGTLYLHCIMNLEVYEFVRTVEGVKGFIGSQVEINKSQFVIIPRPQSADEMEPIFLQEKEQQESVDKAFKEKAEGITKSPQRKTSNRRKSSNRLLPGTGVRVLSGPFADYNGCLKELNKNKKKATVQLELFGKESFVELDIDQIDANIA